MGWRGLRSIFAGIACAAVLGTGFAGAVHAQDNVRVGVLLDGTASWEMQVIRDRQLDEAFGFELVLRDVAGKQASHVAFMSDEVDIVLSDFVWVAALRAQGQALTSVPHSQAVGGLLVRGDSRIRSISDLPGATIGIAGGPLDKSWVILQAYYAAQTGETLPDKVTARFGAPPLINALLAEGRIDAALNFWHFNARAKEAGAREVKSVSQMMSEMRVPENPPLLVWVFREDRAAENPQKFRAFLDASFAAKGILLNDDAAWDALRDKMGAADNPALFNRLRDDYRAGILSGYDERTISAASAAFAILAEHGGPELVGEQATMDEGTFWAGYRH